MTNDTRNASALSRRGFIGAGAAAAFAATSVAERAAAQGRDRLVFALSSYPPSLRPWANTGTAAGTAKCQFLRGLLSYGPKGEIRGELASM